MEDAWPHATQFCGDYDGGIDREQSRIGCSYERRHLAGAPDHVDIAWSRLFRGDDAYRPAAQTLSPISRSTGDFCCAVRPIARLLVSDISLGWLAWERSRNASNARDGGKDRAPVRGTSAQLRSSL